MRRVQEGVAISTSTSPRSTCDRVPDRVRHLPSGFGTGQRGVWQGVPYVAVADVVRTRAAEGNNYRSFSPLKPDGPVSGIAKKMGDTPIVELARRAQVEEALAAMDEARVIPRSIIGRKPQKPTNSRLNST